MILTGTSAAGGGAGIEDFKIGGFEAVRADRIDGRPDLFGRKRAGRAGRHETDQRQVDGHGGLQRQGDLTGVHRPALNLLLFQIGADTLVWKTIYITVDVELTLRGQKRQVSAGFVFFQGQQVLAGPGIDQAAVHIAQPQVRNDRTAALGHPVGFGPQHIQPSGQGCAGKHFGHE